MKKILILLAFLYLHTLQAQKYDHNWMTGYSGEKGTKEDEYGITQTNFNDETAKCEYLKSTLFIDGYSTSMSDKDGNLIFYTNGLKVFNNKHQILKNSENFNQSTFHDGYAKAGLPGPQGIVALPMPNNIYYLLYSKTDWVVSKKGACSTGLNYAIIDMKGDNGQGEMLLKNIPLIKDTLNTRNINAVRHANGRDWWVLISKFTSNEYYRILLSPKGLQLLPNQTVGDTMKNSLSQICFSLDGKKYARNGLKYTYEPAEFDIYDFDRCKGLLSNHKRLYYPTEKTFAVGLSFSTNNKFAYTMSRNKAIQWDLTAKDISKSGDTIAYYDGYIEDDIKVLQANFYMSQIAPDGKIYINSSNSTKHFHVVHKPNKKGVACQMQQHAFRLKSRNSGTLPNYPNYRLGPLDGSPCDTLGIDNIPVALFRYDKDTLNTFLVEFTDLSHHEPAKWEWDFGDGSPKSATQEPVHTYKSKGEYQVCLTVSNTNGKHTACKKIGVGVTVGVEDASEPYKVSIYPNPAEDFFHIHSKRGTFSISITDIQGRIIYTSTAQNDATIDTNTWQSGIYQVLITDKISGQKSIEKVVIMR